MDTHYDYCVINKRDNTITLYNKDKSLDIRPLDVDILLDVNILFDERNNLVIEGNPLIFELSTCRTPVNELEHTPRKKYIKQYNPGWFAKLFGIKPYKYVYGWWAYLSETTVTYILNKYQIKLI